MKKINSILHIGMLALLVGTATGLVGCANTGEDRYTQGSKQTPRLAENKFRFNGTILYHRQGDYYTIVAGSGYEYYPLNLPEHYRKSGLLVQVYGESRGYALNGSARAIEVFDIKELTH